MPNVKNTKTPQTPLATIAPTIAPPKAEAPATDVSGTATAETRGIYLLL